jgi:hypothetical protein
MVVAILTKVLSYSVFNMYGIKNIHVCEEYCGNKHILPLIHSSSIK